SSDVCAPYLEGGAPCLPHGGLHIRPRLRRDRGRWVVRTVLRDGLREGDQQLVLGHRRVLGGVLPGGNRADQLDRRRLALRAVVRRGEVLPRQLGVLREGTDSPALATAVDLPGLADRKRDHGVLEGCISLSRRDLPVPVRGEQRLAGQELLEWNSLVPGGRLLREVALLHPARDHREA